MYLVSLGDFADRELYTEIPSGVDKNLAWLMFLLSSFVVLIMFSNMIIGVMGLPFDIVLENKIKYINQFKIGLIVDFKNQVDLKNIFKNYKYIIVA